MQNGIPVGLRSSPSFGLSRSGQLTAIIQSLFWDGSQGWWYDDDDLTTLFQDSAGTTPVTAVEQFVGLQLDKSKGLVLGPELVTNGDFSAGTTGWATWNANAQMSVANGQMTITQPVGGNQVGVGNSVAYTTVVGRFYVVALDVISYVGAGPPQMRIGDFNGSASINGNLLAGTGRRYFYFQANTTATFVNVATASAAGSTITFDNISVRELPGNHRYAPASGNRPKWSKLVNLLTKTEQFNDSTASVGWNNTIGGTGAVPTITADAGTDPLGGNTADRLQTSRSTATLADRSARSSAVTNVTFELGVSYTVSFSAKAYTGSSQPIHLMINANNAVVQSYIATDVWQRFTYTFTSGATIANSSAPVRFGLWGTASADLSSDVLIWGADLRPSNQATGLLPLYQRVNTSTDYDTNGFPGYLKADGVDDFLQTNSIDFTATDKITLCAGVRKLSDAATGVFAELSANWNSNNGSFFSSPNENLAGASTTFNASSRGTAVAASNQFAVSASTPSPVTVVWTFTHDIAGDLSAIRLNGAASGTDGTGDKGSGNFGNYPVYFFHRNTSPATLRFNGYEYGNIAVGKLLTADQLTALETYMNGLTKAY